MIRNEFDLRDFRRSFRIYMVTMILSRLGLFKRLDKDHARTADWIADALAIDRRAAQICADLMTGIGLLVEDGNGYRLGPAAWRLRPALEECGDELDESLALPSCIRTGLPWRATAGGVLDDDPDASHRFLAGLHRRTADAADDLAAEIYRLSVRHGIRGSSRGLRGLDLGGGHGRFAAALAVTFPGAEITLFDREPVVAIARELSGAGFRIQTGDYLRDDLGSHFDLVLLSNVLHGENDRDATALLIRACEALDSRGLVVIRDRLVQGRSVGPLHALEFGVPLLTRTTSGRPRTVAEVRGMLEAASLTPVHFRQAPSEECCILVGLKGNL